MPIKRFCPGNLFQFLIGKLKTEFTKVCSIIVLKFQFLIGKLKTDDAPDATTGIAEFQFLIGKLKTKSDASK